MSEDYGHIINFQSKLEILNFLFEDFLVRILNMPSLINLVVTFTKCGYFDYNCKQVETLYQYIANSQELNNFEVINSYFNNVIGKIEDSTLAKLDKSFLTGIKLREITPIQE